MHDAHLLFVLNTEGIYCSTFVFVGHSHVLDYNVLVWHQAINPIVPPLPPVFRCPLIQQQGGALLERQLSRRAPDVVKLGNGFNRLTLCQEKGLVRLSTCQIWQSHQVQMVVISCADISND